MLAQSWSTTRHPIEFCYEQGGARCLTVVPHDLRQGARATCTGRDGDDVVCEYIDAIVW